MARIIINSTNTPKMIHPHGISFFDGGGAGAWDGVHAGCGDALAPCRIVSRIAWFFDCGAAGGVGV